MKVDREVKVRGVVRGRIEDSVPVGIAATAGRTPDGACCGAGSGSGTILDQLCG